MLPTFSMFNLSSRLGMLLAMLAIGFFLALMLCIVLKISFSLNAEVLVIKKHGVFRYFSHYLFDILTSKLRRSTTLEFAINRTSLHYYRTHFSDEQAWLQLIIKEGPRFYQIFSWKGKVRGGREACIVLLPSKL